MGVGGVGTRVLVRDSYWHIEIEDLFFFELWSRGGW